MELLERDLCLDILSKKFNNAKNGDGNVMILAGEAGVGKTTLINHFLKGLDSSYTILSGACDSFFTPRPLGPLYDISIQLGHELLSLLKQDEDRSVIFTMFMEQLMALKGPSVVVIEDLHWADEATIDFIKFFGKRIGRLKSFLLLTYRDDEINNRHPARSIFGALQPDIYTKLFINRLSLDAVNSLARAKGYQNGERVYALTGGNPFYVNEILASYSPGIPDRVKDSVLSVFKSMGEKNQALWEFLSILPSGIDLVLVEKLDMDFPNGIENCIRTGIIVDHKDHYTFKHELFRLAIEESLSSHKRKDYHSRVLRILISLEKNEDNFSRIVHHAKFAGEEKIGAKYAELAAERAFVIGSYTEAATLFEAAIQFLSKENRRIDLFERLARACYLSGQFERAIHFLQTVLLAAKDSNNAMMEAQTLHFLSRLWLLNDDPKKAISLCCECVELLCKLPSGIQIARAYGNLSQLHLLSEDFDDALKYGETALQLSRKLGDKEGEAYSMCTIGAVQVRYRPVGNGLQTLRSVIEFAKRNQLPKQAARAYSKLMEAVVTLRMNTEAMAIYDEGSKFCEDNDLTGGLQFLNYWKSVMLTNSGNWSEAERLANNGKNASRTVIRIGSLILLTRIAARRGNIENAKLLIGKLRDMIATNSDTRFKASQLSVELEFQWIKGELIAEDVKNEVAEILSARKKSWYLHDLRYWAEKINIAVPGSNSSFHLFGFESSGSWKTIAEGWRSVESPYEEALALAQGNETSKKQALKILDELGASAGYKRLRFQLKSEGFIGLPRGYRDSTRNNPAHLTVRQVEVLKMLQGGFQNSEIAERLFVTSKTVEQHVTAILSKLEVSSRAKAVLEAKRRGLL